MEEKKSTTEELKETLGEKKEEHPSTGSGQEKTSKEDVEKNKVMAIVGYIIPILFFVPLLNEASKKSPFANFHANQQLILLIFCFGGYVIASFLMVILIGFILMPVIWIASIVFMIMGIINAANGEMKKLPIIGNFNIIK